MDNEICCLCLEEITSSSINFQCGHSFHKHCANQFIRCNHNYNHKCPMCRKNIEKIDVKNKLVDLPKYDDDDYVWIFGYFRSYSNYMKYDIRRGHLQSGCLWTMYDEDMIKYFEDNFKKSYDDKSKLEFDIGSKIYYIDFSKNYLDDEVFGFIQDIKDDNLTKIRPVIRIKFSDMIKYKFTIGIGNNIFLDKYLVRNNTNNIINLYDQIMIANDKSDSELLEDIDEFDEIELSKLKTYPSLKIIS